MPADSLVEPRLVDELVEGKPILRVTPARIPPKISKEM
jgi:hypothetical protein